MSTQAPAPTAPQQPLSDPNTIQIPEWDSNAVHTSKDGVATTSQPGAHHGGKAVLQEKFNAVLPRSRSYFGLKRRTFLIVVACAFLALLALIIGLAVGLTKHSKGGQNLPLPTNSEQHEGDLTYYGTGLGSCGLTSTDSDMIVAVSHYVFDAASRSSDPNQNPLCGLKLRASRYDEQVGERRSVDLKVVDRCVGCAATDIDVSPAAFDKLAARASGRVDVTWAWLSPQATA
ncbi:hypothetical protein D6C78_05026 [Aureobasidium pullulans]|uniref:RlpA-like protein double-psi beta-barrel domain-containing protein n=2 Tax=Aureobasidium pullulans TaxID=5580 RepID=A0A074XLX7_AURPU|nr:uncharacterized protein M438DRAFT_315044 [Aureobasidium pullulans EXF-150]KEQ86498.1 hypothetical protein M438DRAFT_315044 [Aureobasidium pullulans EXF-150]TIA37005.1 hypothetical protein D6C78_05026 [Aureobasidium pullulans]